MKSNRRKFIKQGCIGCMGLTAIGSLITACSTPLEILRLGISTKPNMLQVPTTKFTDAINMLIVRPKDYNDDILLIKTPNEYKAVLLVCTHEDFPLSANDKGIFCAAHGSKFNFDGEVIREPALKPLKKFKTEIKDSNINIYI